MVFWPSVTPVFRSLKTGKSRRGHKYAPPLGLFCDVGSNRKIQHNFTCINKKSQICFKFENLCLNYLFRLKKKEVLVNIIGGFKWGFNPLKHQGELKYEPQAKNHPRFNFLAGDDRSYNGRSKLYKIDKKNTSGSRDGDRL